MLNRLLIAPISSSHRAFKSVYSLIVLEKEIPSFKPKAIRIVEGWLAVAFARRSIFVSKFIQLFNEHRKVTLFKYSGLGRSIEIENCVTHFVPPLGDLLL